MSAAPITGSMRPFQLVLTDRSSRALWLSRAGELLGDWTMLVALLAIVYRFSGSVPVVGLFVLARVLPRAFTVTTGGIAIWSDPRSLALLNAARVPLIASLALVSKERDLWWAAAVVVVVGAMGAVSDAGRAALLRSVVPRAMLNMTNTLNVSVERLCFLFGPLLGAVILSQWSAGATFVAAAVLLACAAGLLLLLPRPQATPGVAESVARTPLSSIRQRPLLMTIAASLFTSAAVAVSLLVALIMLVTGPLERSEATLGALLACVGLGMFAGPLTISKLMGRLPVPFLLAGAAACLGGGLILISQIAELIVVAVILFLMGLCAITNDTIAATALRRNVREVELAGTSRAMFAVIVAGQLVGAAVVTIGSSIWSVTSVLLVTGIVGAAAMAMLFLALYGGYYLKRVARR